MSLTEEEKAELERQRCEAKVRCREIWGTIVQLQEWLATYKFEHTRWSRRFEKADRKLAEEDGRLHRVTGKRAEDIKDGVHLLVKLDQFQLERIKKALEEMDEDN